MSHGCKRTIDPFSNPNPVYGHTYYVTLCFMFVCNGVKNYAHSKFCLDITSYEIPFTKHIKCKTCSTTGTKRTVLYQTGYFRSILSCFIHLSIKTLNMFWNTDIKILHKSERGYGKSFPDNPYSRDCMYCIWIMGTTNLPCADSFPQFLCH